MKLTPLGETVAVLLGLALLLFLLALIGGIERGTIL